VCHQAALTALATAAWCAGAAAAPAGDARAAWTANDISVTQSVEGRERASTRFEVGANGDARVAVSRDEEGVYSAGTILLIGGHWMLTRGFTAAPAKAVSALDVAALNSQLVIVLLTAALPTGPPAKGAPPRVHFAEKTQRIRIATATATGEYDAPWSIDGTVTAGAAGATGFRLTFTCSERGHPATTVFAGSLGNSEPPLQLPDSMRLAGWTLRRIGPGAASPQHKPATIGELRKLE